MFWTKIDFETLDYGGRYGGTKDGFQGLNLIVQFL